ncbi:uncharacterized protein LOC129723276 isoform X2 [Wyeomyia smithii]|uniref:uncharacterized protein LOC129723276 isoform X2 n=1 Tax=Wyeomyia smithii TaxID=174621 RepID=UPI002467BCEA|nr:uncharacterized protein LOC129723276 isoform X2 [Wyeomyia smithii]
MTNSKWILLIHVILFSAEEVFTKKSSQITLEDSYHYIIIGSDHVAQSLGFHLAQREPLKTVLVLNSNQCDCITELSNVESDPFVLSLTSKFAESAHQLKFQFVDPLSPGLRVGVVYKNTSGTVLDEHQTLLAIDPNLKLLTGARIIRLLYNPGRCSNDYKHLSVASIISETMLADLLVGMPLDVSFGSPILAPVLYTKGRKNLQKNPTLLTTELYLNTNKTRDRGTHTPDARLNMLVGKANSNSHLWIGFVPSIYSSGDLHYIPDHEESVKILSSALKIASQIASCDMFKQLKLTLHDQHTPECMKFVGSEQYWTCYVHNKLRRFEKRSAITRHNKTLLSGDFYLNGVKGLRIIPFGLNTPFLNRQWHRLFPVANYTTAPTTTTMSSVPGLTTQSREQFSSEMDKFIEALTGLSKEAFEKRILKHMLNGDSKLSASSSRHLFEKMK